MIILRDNFRKLCFKKIAMDENRSKSLNEFLYEPGFQNLVQGVHALITARKSLCDLIEQHWKHFIARLPNTEKEQLGRFIECINHHGIQPYFASIQNEPLGCGHETCALLYTRLRKLSYGTGDISAEQDVKSLLQEKQQNFCNTDSCYSFIWDLANCFIGVKTQNVKLHGRELNAKTLVKLMKYCRMFAFNDSERMYCQVLEDIDKLINARDLLISTEDLEVMIIHLLELLKPWKKNCQSCSYGIEDIRKLQHGDADFKNFEYQLLVKNVLEMLESMLDDNESESDHPGNIKNKEVTSSKELISSLLSQVDDKIFEQEPNELLELQQKVKSLKEENKKLQTEIAIENSKGEAKMKENRELQNKMKQLEADHSQQKSSKDEEISINKELQLKLKNLESDLKRQGEAKMKENRELQNKMKQLEEENSRQKTISTQAQSELSETKQESKRLKDEKLKLQTEIDEMKSSKDEEISINKELQLKLKNLESDLERQKTLSTQAQSELSNTKQENKRLEDDNLKLQMEGEAKMKENRELQNKMKQLEEENSRQKTISTQAQSELSETKQERKRLKDDKLKLQTEIDEMKTILTQAQSELSDTKQESKRFKDDKLKLQTEIDEMKTLSTQAQSELSNTKQENKRLEDDNLKLQIEGEAKMKEIRELQNKIKQLEADHSRQVQHWPLFDNDVVSTEIYQKALSEGVENDKSIRVNVFGNFARGKTSLTNILVGKDLKSVQSTNGVEISRCFYSTAHESVIFCSQRSSSDDHEYYRRIASSVQMEKDGNKSTQSTYNSELIKLNEESASLQGNVRKTDLKKDIGKSLPKSRDYREDSSLLKMNQCGPFNADGELLFWDFGGPFTFCATHTLFHSTTSVYLMVFDLTKPLSAFIEDPEFSNESVGKSIQQSAEYWMRSIHTYVGSDDGLQPPVILVGTHKDLLKGNENIQQTFADDYFDKIRELFKDTPVINHIQAKHFAVDCTNPCDSSIVELRKEIIRLGSDLHRKPIPARWLPLEQKLLAKRHKKIILYSEVVEIDGSNEFPINNKEQIKVFLLYQHAKGNLIYFDEEPLSAYVALDTQYVIDAFTCIITSEKFCKREPTYRHLWKTLRQEAKLNIQLLDRVWSTDAKNNFLEHKDVLLMLLQRHYFISEALSYDDQTEETKGLGWYVVPCFLRSYRANDALKEFVTGRQQTMLKFVMSFNISPVVVQIVFYRVIAALVGKWEIVSFKMPKREKQVLLYANLGVFKLDRQHVGIIKIHQGFIELRVKNLCYSGINAAIVDLFRRFVVSNVMNEFRKHRQTSTMPRTPYEICFKCNHESHCLDGSQQTVSLTDLKGTTVEPCPDMVSGHTINTQKAYYEWFPDDLNIGVKTDFVLKERDLSKLSTTVGKNWERLGIELGLSIFQIQHINCDYPSTEIKIFKMLLEWTDQRPGDATPNTLIQSMKSATDVSIDWDEVKNIIEEITSKKSIKLAPKTSTSHEI